MRAECLTSVTFGGGGKCPCPATIFEGIVRLRRKVCAPCFGWKQLEFSLLLLDEKHRTMLIDGKISMSSRHRSMAFFFGG